MANIVDKYFIKKKKQIFDYCKSVNEFLLYDNNQVWKTDSELNEFLKNTISSYVDKYYFTPLEEFEEYSEFIGPLIKSDNRFKTILVCALENIPNNLRIGNFKISLYIMTLIIYTSVVLDRFTYAYNNYKVNLTNVESIVEPMFNGVSFIKFNPDHKKMKMLTNDIKKNDFIEKDFIDSIGDLNSEVSKNLYEAIDNENKYYKVIYKYDIPELKDFRKRDIEKYFKRIKDDLNCISYELSTLSALKIKMLNKDINILFPVSLEFYQNEIELNKLVKIMGNAEVKSIIKLYASYDDYKKNPGIIRLLTNAGFGIVINFEDSLEVPYGTFNEIKEVTINHDFEDFNKGNINSWRESGTKFIQKTMVATKPVEELEMLGIREG